jgi:hypothetical protein
VNLIRFRLVNTTTVKCKMKMTQWGTTGAVERHTVTCERDVRPSPWHGLEGERERKEQESPSHPARTERSRDNETVHPIRVSLHLETMLRDTLPCLTQAIPAHGAPMTMVILFTVAHAQCARTI